MAPRDRAGVVLVSTVHPHVSGPGAGSRGGVVPNPRHCAKILPGGRGWDGGRAASVRGPLGMPDGRSASVGDVTAMARDGAGEVLASPVCPHVSGPGAGSRGGVVPNLRHCTKILPGGRGWNGGEASLVQGPLVASAGVGLK